MPFFWFIVGAGLGWWADVLFGRQPPIDAGRDETEVEPSPARCGVLILQVPPIAPAPQTTPALAPAPPGFVVSAIFFIVVGLTTLLVAAHHFDFLSEKLFAFEAFLLSPRVVALLAGIALGLWARRYRKLIAARSKDFYAALLGTETHSSWALQAAVALVALFLIVLAVKPDLLDHIESLRAGDIEAKFANVSTATREASRISLSGLRRSTLIKRYVGFTRDFLDPNTGRAIALDLYDGSGIKGLRIAIRNTLFNGYIEPLAVLLACLEKDDRLDEVRRDKGLIELALTFRNKLLSDSLVEISDWQKVLGLFDRQIFEIGEVIKKEVDASARKDCPSGGPGFGLDDILRKWAKSSDARRSEDAEKLGAWAAAAVAYLRQNSEERPYRLAYVDAYVTGAVSDLLGLVIGATEKAGFLTAIKSGYPVDLRFVQPGLINLFYQLVDAKLTSDATWPLDNKVGELAEAIRGADYILEGVRAKRGSLPPTRRRGSQVDYGKVVDVYLRNRLFFVAKHVEIYVQQVLSGEPISDLHRRKWTSVVRQLEAALNLQGSPIKLVLDDIGEHTFSDSDKAEWANVLPSLRTDFAAYLFDARVNIALSAVMLTERRRVAPAHACAAGRTHLAAAEGLVPDVVRAIDGNEADTAVFRGYLEQVKARINASCGP
jgi:hypothetical protein